MLFLLLLCITAPLYGEQPAQLSTQEKIDIFSEFVGYTIGNQFKEMGLSYNVSSVMKGLEKFKDGESLDIIAVRDGMALALQIQEELFEMKAEENLVKTDAFFKNVSNNPDIVRVLDNQLYFEKLQCGQGVDIVGQDSEPLVHYTAKTIENIVIADTYAQGAPVRIPLFEVVPGFSKGIDGMLVGEKRRIYVHPDLAYKRGGLVPPNSVLIFEVEVVSL